MPSTTTYERWELVLVPFPFTDFSSAKRRPALIVSPDNYNTGKDVVIAYVTSRMSVSPQFGDYDIRNWSEAGLPKPSRIRMKFATIDKSIILRSIGKLDSIDSEDSQKTILAFFNAYFAST